METKYPNVIVAGEQQLTDWYMAGRTVADVDPTVPDWASADGILSFSDGGLTDAGFRSSLTIYTYDTQAGDVSGSSVMIDPDDALRIAAALIKWAGECGVTEIAGSDK